MAEPEEFGPAPTSHRYSIEQTYRREDPILVDRERLERRLTAELIEYMRRDGVVIDPSTRLPGFSLHRHGDFVPAGHVVARIECSMWKQDPELIGRIARG